MVLVDSSVWREALRKTGRLDIKVAMEGLLEVDEARWCAPTRLEILGNAPRDIRKPLEESFSAIPCLTCGDEDWDRAHAFLWKLRENGLSAPWPFALVASISLHNNMRLFALREGLEKISVPTGLKLYKPGYGGIFQPEAI